MVYRIYVEKRSAFANEARSLKNELVELLGLKIASLRLLNRYDVEDISEELFRQVIGTVFSEPQVDDTYLTLPDADDTYVFAVEFLPGQFDQRAESAAECIQLISRGERPLVRSAKVYMIQGDLSDEDKAAIRKYVINPVEAREAALGTYETLRIAYEIPTSVATVTGFRDMLHKDLLAFLEERGLAMDLADLELCQEYFRSVDRDPTITEIKVIDTYWSDHCRHTTFNTTIDKIKFEDPKCQAAFKRYMETRETLGRTKPVTLMDIGTIAAKYLKAQGKLQKLDESEEINACTVKIQAEIDGELQDWLLLFKNETHNHPTEIEPFGGAATCIGGAIRDPLSGRSYVYSAMRVTGAADPLKPVSETLPGKLPQRKIVTTAAAGYSSYGNQIGLATGQVDEVYHPGYVAKRMEIGAVVAAAPAANVRRERPQDGDVIILLGGRTGRDGCGGATGSSKSHTLSSLETCGAEVQKGNAPEERKLQRLFRNPEASRMIKRCNDFGAGGVSVAIGELADGLTVDLNQVPKKYEGLDGTELAISESQERMAIVVGPEDVERFCEIAASENLEATVVAKVTAEPQLKLLWNGEAIVDISRAFLDTNGAEKHIEIIVGEEGTYERELCGDFASDMKALAGDLNICSKRGLSERFDSTIGAGTVLMPFGGKRQLTPIQAMVNLVSEEKGHTPTCSAMAWGFDPYISAADPYRGAYLAVVSSVAKLIATGCSFKDVYLSFQEYFAKPEHVPQRWGQPLAALLGAFDAQMNLEVAAIGGKDSMSGSFENIDVPPTLVSFAVTTTSTDRVISPEFKEAGRRVVWVRPERDKNGLPTADSLKYCFVLVEEMMRSGMVAAAYTPTMGGVAEAVLKMALGNRIGFAFEAELPEAELFGEQYGSFLLEMKDGYELPESDRFTVLGHTKENYVLCRGDESLEIAELEKIYEDKLEPIYSCNIQTTPVDDTTYTYEAKERPVSGLHIARPRVLIPAFPGTNCEYDTAKAFRDAGAEPEIFIVRNIRPEYVAESVESFAKKVRESQIIFIPGGFSGGDEPDGSGKFITAFFRNGEIKDAVSEFLEVRGGLMAGICNGFQALIKLGLVPYGRIMDVDASCPTLTYNEIGRHQSKLVRTRIASNLSPWMAETKPGEIYTIPISHGEGRFIASEELIAQLAKSGQILTQYVDEDGKVTGDIHFNPNGSYHAIEGITSPDGRVLGKMAHSERIGAGLYQNVPGNFDMGMFRSAVNYFK
ncbi:MAG: phosphoribosylformylglycinamidine synthase [Clostridia bacterium]|nr:phosphoribosylformylglycinamidine synthase [Clostridia bacterium]